MRIAEASSYQRRNKMSRRTWDRQDAEPPIWYARFDTYRLIGPHRTLEEAFRRSRTIEGFTATRPGAAWYDRADAWNWRQRAEQWDAWNRDEIQRTDAQRRIDKREQRLGIIDGALSAVLSAFEVADIPSLDIDTARNNLPTLRMLLRDLLHAQRAEVGVPVAYEQTANNATLTADDFAAAQAELERWQQQQGLAPA